VVAVAGVAAAGWLLLGGEVTPSPQTIRSIAVLPLENLTGDPGQEYFADGMTEAVISEFARLGGLRVISRTSVMRYKQSDKSLPEIAQELNVQGVVEGSLFRTGDRVRISLQLIDARTDLHLWAQTYERDLSDVLVLQSDVAQAIAEQILLELTSEQQEALTASRTVDPRAYDAYLRGLERRGEATLVMAWGPSAIEQFERAVALDPDFAGGWGWLAGVRVALGFDGYNLGYRDQFPKAREAAERSLEIDDRVGRSHSTLGALRLYHDWDFPGARRAYQRALQLTPSSPVAVNSWAWYLLLVEGRAEEALDVSERLLHVAPLDGNLRGNRVSHFFYARQYDRALDEAERVRGLDRGFVSVDLALAYLMLGRLEDANHTWIAFFERCGAPCDWMKEAMQRGWAQGGWEGSVRAWLESATSAEGFSPVLIAGAYTTIGETDEAFAWLERGYRERDPQIINVKAQPTFDPLRSDPRFDDLLRRIGFPED
jgi:TolB-like protein/Flp pilus assembly protein TadD